MYLQKYNVPISDYLCEQFINNQIQGKFEYITDVLGWQDVPGVDTKKFILNKLVIPGVPPINYFDNSLSFIKGTKEGQIDFLEKEVFPYKQTRLATVIGLSSVLSSLIEPKKNIGCLIINITGCSTTGKSTIADLTASFFGTPETDNNGLVRTFNATQNFIFAVSEGRNGLPVILDDTSIQDSSKLNKSELIYQFAAGQPKGRCNSDGTPQINRKKWGGIVMITSENPLIDEDQMLSGAKVRTFTVENMVWTQDAKHSDRIKDGVRENYGFVGYDYAKFVGKKNLEELYEQQDKNVEVILDKMLTKDALSGRMARKLAPIVSTAELFNEFYGKEVIDVNEIVDMLVEKEQQTIRGRDSSELFYDNLLSYVNTKKEHFDKWYQDSTPNNKKLKYEISSKGDKYGAIHYMENNSFLLFDELCFKKFIEVSDIKEWNNIRKKLVNKGILIMRDNEHFVHKANRKYASPHFKFNITEFDTSNRSIEVIVEEENIADPTLKQDTPISNINFYNKEDVEEIFKE